jgi:small conductance mechanosensitive channel
VPFRESDRAVTIVDRVCEELAKEREAVLIGVPRVVDQKATPDGQVTMKVSGDARPPNKWSVEADLRRRLKRAFEGERVEMEFAGAAEAAAK